MASAAHAPLAALVGFRFILDGDAIDALDEARDMTEKLTNDYLRLTRDVKADPATVTLVLRTIQTLKNLMFDSFRQPHAPKEYAIEGESETAKKRKERV